MSPALAACRQQTSLKMNYCLHNFVPNQEGRNLSRMFHFKHQILPPLICATTCVDNVVDMDITAQDAARQTSTSFAGTTGPVLGRKCKCQPTPTPSCVSFCIHLIIFNFKHAPAVPVFAGESEIQTRPPLKWDSTFPSPNAELS